MNAYRGSWLILAAVAGCQTPPAADRAAVSAKIAGRFDVVLGSAVPISQLVVPDGFDAGKPIPEDQAVCLAICNNPLFQEQLADLKLTRADLVQAGLLPNPEFVYFWPAPDKPFKYLVDFPLESLWLRPIRVKAAAAENDRTADRLAQLGLDLIRDTRLAYADVRFAADRAAVAREAVKVRTRIADLAEGRRKAGTATVQEAATARTDALRAEQDASRVDFDVTLAADRLKALTGLTGFPNRLEVVDTSVEIRETADVETLVAEAIRTRPDAAAAEAAVRAAGERLRVAKIAWIRVLGLADATSGRATGHEFGGAARVTVPLFNRNQGAIARAEADVEQLDRRRLTVQTQIALDVRQAHARYRQAAAEWAVMREKVRPEVDAGVKRAETALAAGGASYLLALEAARQVIDTMAREAQLRADLRRAWADLERGVGRKLPAAEKLP